MPSKSDAAKAEDDALAGKEPEKTKINVVLVAISIGSWRRMFIEFASEGSDESTSAVDFKFQNIPFALNILDSLAGDDTVHRPAEADASAPHFDESGRGDRGTAEGSARRAGRFL